VAEIRRTLSGTPDPATGAPTFSFGARAGYFLRHFPQFGPQTPRARELYRHLADLMESEASGAPKAIHITHAKLSRYLCCSERAVSALVRQLARTGLLPLVGVTPGRTGRASRFIFVCDPFSWAENQDAEAVCVRAKRQLSTIDEQLSAFRAEERGEITPERREQLERVAQLKREWNQPPRESRAERFQKRLAAAREVADSGGLRAMARQNVNLAGSESTSRRNARP